jgi:hypothetical protein
MSNVLTVDGIPAIEVKIGEISGLFSSPDVKDVYMEAAQAFLDVFRETAPVVTGRFRRSGFIERGSPDKPDVLFMIDYGICPYAHIVEYGSAKQAPHATIRRATLSAASEVESVIEAGLKQKLRDKF